MPSPCCGCRRRSPRRCSCPAPVGSRQRISPAPCLSPGSSRSSPGSPAASAPSSPAGSSWCPSRAALSGSRRVVVAAVAAAVAAAIGLYLGFATGLAPQAAPLALGSVALFVGAASAVVYAGGLAIGLEAAHRRAEQTARRDETRYRLLADNATDLISRHTRSGLVLFASPAAEALTGAPASDLADDGLFRRVHVADRPAFLGAFSDAAASGNAITVAFRLKVDLPEQGFRWVEMRCRPIAGTAGAVEIVAVTRDIDPHKRQEEALLAANGRAAQANEAKTRFLANMSHELRTPLNAIIGFSDMMMHDSFDGNRERTAEYAKLIRDSGKHLLDVVNGILDMSKIETGSFDIVPEPFDARELVASTVALMQPAADKTGITLMIELPANAPELNADRRACKQILLNLLSNAVKFTKAGGKVTTALTFDDESAYLTVTDTGIGISDEDLPKLATPFVQAQSSYDRNYEGTGLGLSVVKGLAELHGGTLLLSSRLGEGTSVTVRLPIDCEAPRDVVTPVPRQGGRRHRRAGHARKEAAPCVRWISSSTIVRRGRPARAPSTSPRKTAGSPGPASAARSWSA
jgi:cell cycle sensor histidine kinase DivJ